jgi:hypothetical protein
MHQGIIYPPLNGQACLDFLVIQYAYDTLVILKEDAQELICLKSNLHSFASLTGLKVNYSKSSMMSINMEVDRLHHFAKTINCKLGSLPFAYLTFLWNHKTLTGTLSSCSSKSRKKAMWHC